MTMKSRWKPRECIFCTRYAAARSPRLRLIDIKQNKQKKREREKEKGKQNEFENASVCKLNPPREILSGVSPLLVGEK